MIQALKSFISAFTVLTLLAGCASVSMGDKQEDAMRKTFQVAPDKAGLYIYRNESLGAALKMDVYLDGQKMGQTAANTYLYKEVSPGVHQVASQSKDNAIQVTAQPGTLSYIWQEVKMGLMSGGSKLQIVSQDQGQKGVKETSLAASQ